MDKKKVAVSIVSGTKEESHFAGVFDGLKEQGFEIDLIPLCDSKDPETVIAALKDADYLIAGCERLDETTLPYLKKMKLIVRFGVGYDTVDLPSAKKYGIKVTNLPGSNAFAVAEHVLGLMIAATHQMVRLTNCIRSNIRVEDTVLDSLSGTVGLLGFGAIARHLVRMLEPFDVTIKAYDPFVSAEDMAKLGVEKTEMDELIRTADLLSLHLPATPETHKMVNAEFVAKMKDGAFLFNAARGALMDEQAVADALHSGKLAGLGVDVFAVEPLDGSSPLVSAPNTVMTPHICTHTKSCFRKVLVDSIHQIELFEQGQSVVNELTQKI